MSERERERESQLSSEDASEGPAEIRHLRARNGAAGPRDWEMSQELNPRKTSGTQPVPSGTPEGQSPAPHHPEKTERDLLQAPLPSIRGAQTQGPTSSDSQEGWSGLCETTARAAAGCPGVSFPWTFLWRQGAN